MTQTFIIDCPLVVADALNQLPPGTKIRWRAGVKQESVLQLDDCNETIARLAVRGQEVDCPPSGLDRQWIQWITI